MVGEAGSVAPGQIEVGADWHDLLDTLVTRPGGRVGVLGSSGTGKSTLARWLGSALAAVGPTARLDADPGQTRIGPPATISLGREPAAEDHPAAVCFIGDVSPARNFLGMAAGVARLGRVAGKLGLDHMVLDPPGYLDFPSGHALHLHLVRVLELDHLVVLDGHALAPVLDPLRRSARPAIHEIQPSPAVVDRSRTERRAYRDRRFQAALQGARSRRLPDTIPLHGILPQRDEDWAGRLIGLLDRDGFLLRLAIAQERAEGTLRIRSPDVDFDEVSSAEVGSVRVDL